MSLYPIFIKIQRWYVVITAAAITQAMDSIAIHQPMVEIAIPQLSILADHMNIKASNHEKCENAK